MSEELMHAIKVMDRLEKEMQMKWGRGDYISKEMILHLQNARQKVKELQQPLTNPHIKE
jgi:hypothetical protein